MALINTLVHELGHAFMTTLTGGRVQKIELFANSEGKAWSENHWFGRLLTTAAGYPAASAAAYLCLYLIYDGNYTLMMFLFSGILVVSFLLWIRNIYGFLWVISFGGLFAYLHYLDNPALTVNILLFLAAILFVESITSAFDILLLSITQPRDAGDATNMANATFIIPAPVWGLAFFAQSILFAWMSVRLFI